MLKPLVTFRGPVAVVQARSGALGLTLAGLADEAAGEPTTLAFSGAAPANFPEGIVDLTVNAVDAVRYRLASPAGEWQVDATAAHLHHEVSAEFYRVLPPRPVPFAKRCLWAVVLTLAKSRAGLRLLAALRR
jgi:hypothetical protein